MACSICHREGHNRTRCPHNPQHIAQRRRLAAMFGVQLTAAGHLPPPTKTAKIAAAVICVVLFGGCFVCLSSPPPRGTTNGAVAPGPPPASKGPTRPAGRR